jgi:multidrug/hemolysin transport system permease protein
MAQMLNFAYRNLRLYFCQKNMVFFSLLGVFIILGLYIVFLGDIWLAYTENISGAGVLLNAWIVAGVISVASITTSMGAAGIMVEDKAKRNIKDFYTVPIARSSIIGGYLLSIFVIGFIMSLLALLLGELYIVLRGGTPLQPGVIAEMIGIIALSAISSGSIVFFIVSFISGNGAFTTVSTIIGSLIGFITGIYLPIGTLPDAVQMIIKVFPVSHASALMRRVMMAQPLEAAFSGAPAGYLTDFEEFMGVTFVYGDFTASPLFHAVVLAVVAIGFYIFALASFKTRGGGR